MRIETRFICDDGQEFRTQFEAERHDEYLDFVKHLSEIWHRDIKHYEVAGWIFSNYTLEKEVQTKAPTATQVDKSKETLKDAMARTFTTRLE